MPKILVLDNLSEEGIEILRKADGFEVDVKSSQKPHELAAILGAYDGLVVRSATKVTEEALQGAKKLKVIGRAGVGTDNIDKEAATKRGIVVMNTPGGNTISACEHTFALLFALCRNIPKAHHSMEEGRWDRKTFMGTELCGKTLGIIGIGRIGSAVAKRAQAFEMKIIAYDPLLSKLKAEALRVELVSLDELIERSDFITVHAPSNQSTVNIIRTEQFRRMKPTCRIINCARGGIVNEADLAQALRDHVIAGAALDVYESEPPANNPFLGLDNVVMTPHLAASTDEAQLTVAVDIARQIVDFLSTGAIVNAVNVPSMDGETRKSLEGLLFLAERLGRFQAFFMEGRPISIKIEYAGELGVTDTYPITTAVLAGFLAPLVETVNMVNAPSLLKDHGIEFSEKRLAQPSDYAFHIGVEVTTDKESHFVAGTMFGKRDARICIIDGMRVDAKPEGWMVVCMNEDKPLILGPVATIIGQEHVNIANLTLGRSEPGGRASTVLNLDDPISPKALENIRRVRHINQARMIDLK
jgi:D-3-phosphoglycerate dehydrogenase